MPGRGSAGQWSDHGWGPMKVDFVLRNLQALSQALRQLNIPLLLAESPRFASVPGKILDIARKHKCSVLFFNQEHDGEYIRRFVPELADAPTGALHDPGAFKSLGSKYSGPCLDRAASRARILGALKNLRRQMQAGMK